MISLSDKKEILAYSKALYGFNDKDKTLIYSLGKCTLGQLIKFKKENHISWMEKDLIYILKYFLNLLDLMTENNIFHSDENPKNFVLDQLRNDILNQDNHYILQLFMIDFGISTLSFD